MRHALQHLWWSLKRLVIVITHIRNNQISFRKSNQFSNIKIAQRSKLYSSPFSTAAYTLYRNIKCCFLCKCLKCFLVLKSVVQNHWVCKFVQWWVLQWKFESGGVYIAHNIEQRRCVCYTVFGILNADHVFWLFCWVYRIVALAFINSSEYFDTFTQ